MWDTLIYGISTIMFFIITIIIPIGPDRCRSGWERALTGSPFLSPKGGKKMYMNGYGTGRVIPDVEDSTHSASISLLALRLIAIYSLRWPR